MKNLTQIDIKGSDHIEFIDIVTLINLNRLDENNANILRKIKIKDIDFFPSGIKSIEEEILDEQIKIAYKINFSKLAAAELAYTFLGYFDLIS